MGIVVGAVGTVIGVVGIVVGTVGIVVGTVGADVIGGTGVTVVPTVLWLIPIGRDVVGRVAVVGVPVVVGPVLGTLPLRTAPKLQPDRIITRIIKKYRPILIFLFMVAISFKYPNPVHRVKIWGKHFPKS